MGGGVSFEMPDDEDDDEPVPSPPVRNPNIQRGGLGIPKDDF